VGRVSLFLLLFSAALAPGSLAQELPLDSISVEGNRNLSAAAILQAAGLHQGQRASSATFDSARDRLLASGYFDTVAYRYKPSGKGGYEVVFEVQEVTVLLPVRVEALAISTNDAIALLKSKDPLFSGRMPGTKPALDRASHDLAESLKSKGQPSDVAGRVVAVAPERFEIDFMPGRGLPAVANVTFEGSRVISAIDLHNKANEVAFGQPFSEALFRILLDNQIRPLYEAKGYMNVKFTKIATRPAKDVQGLDVSVGVEEGERYTVSRVSIDGVKDEDNARMLRAAKIPRMTIANGDQIREAAARVKDAMRHEGYLDAEASTENIRDDEKKTVEFFIVVEAGSLYTFGKLTVNGLGLTGEDAVRKLWAVRPGDPFPAGYPDVFAARVKEDGYFDNLESVAAKPQINREAHVVDVTLDFKGAAPKAKPDRRPGGAIYPGDLPPL
jgi:outer membrane protein insertion porin family